MTTDNNLTGQLRRNAELCGSTAKALQRLLTDAADALEAAQVAQALQPVAAAKEVVSILRAGHWREVYIGNRCMTLGLTYEREGWERLMEKVEAVLASPPVDVDVDMVRDAERYRFLRNPENERLVEKMIHIFDYGESALLEDGPELDAAIDAALAAQQGGES